MKKLKNAVFRECQMPACKFRFPDIKSINEDIPCPVCNNPTKIQYSIDLTLDECQVSTQKPLKSIISVLDNIRSVYNVAAMFRTLNGFGQSLAVLGGITPTPSHRNFKKSSLGAEERIQWFHTNNSLDACWQLKKNGYQIISIESCNASQPVTEIGSKDLAEKVVVVVGNEITGVDQEIIFISDLVLAIPIFGSNKSYNVTTAYGIALFQLLFG